MHYKKNTYNKKRKTYKTTCDCVLMGTGYEDRENKEHGHYVQSTFKRKIAQLV